MYELSKPKPSSLPDIHLFGYTSLIIIYDPTYNQDRMGKILDLSEKVNIEIIIHIYFDIQKL